MFYGLVAVTILWGYLISSSGLLQTNILVAYNVKSKIFSFVKRATQFTDHSSFIGWRFCICGRGEDRFDNDQLIVTTPEPFKTSPVRNAIKMRCSRRSAEMAGALVFRDEYHRRRTPR